MAWVGRDPDSRIRWTATAVGATAAYVTALWLVRWWRPAVLFGPDLTWWRLWLAIAVGTVLAVLAAGWAGAALFRRFARTGLARVPLEPFPFRGRPLLLLAAAALVGGACLRVSLLQSSPPLALDESTLLKPTLELGGSLSDFRRPLRAVPYLPVARTGDRERFRGAVGVLYLELSRWSLRTWGTGVVGMRFLSVLGGTVSLGTSVLLARSLLPRGGATIAALVLAGLRWHLIVSSWGWVAVCVTPLIDLSAWLLIRGRRRGSALATVGAGLLLGLGAHVYLTAWVALAALLLFRLWPLEDGEPPRRRAAGAALFLAGFGAVVVPLVVVDSAEDPPYFGRAMDHNVLREIQYRRSLLPPLAIAADALAAPWFVPDPNAFADVPGRSRLGWTLGAVVAIALARGLTRFRDPVSAFLASHAAAALAATIAHGECGQPNGFRFFYLTTPTVIAAAAGTLAIVAAVPPARRRLVALGALGLIALAGVRGARDGCVLWPSTIDTFDAFKGEETLVGKAAVRWASFGAVTVEEPLRTPVVDAIRTYRLYPGPSPAPSAASAGRAFRVAPPGPPRPGERCVERVRDPWGRERAVVWGIRPG